MINVLAEFESALKLPVNIAPLLIILLLSQMRKRAFLVSSIEMPNELQCSSIRINEEQFQQLNQNGRTLNPPKNFGFKQFEEHSLNGLEGSLSMSATKDKMLELMRSKSAQDMHKPENTISNPSKHNDSHTAYGVSLYNTSSFDDTTMKMTINRTNLGSPVQFNDKNDFKQLNKPEELKKFKASYDDSEINIVFNKEEKTVQGKPSIQEEIVQTKEQRQARQLKVAEFCRRQALLDNLKCSNADSEPSRNFQDSASFHQPFFKTPEQAITGLEHQQSIHLNKLEDRRPDIKVNVGPDLHVKKKTQSNSQAAKKQKKLTLRDYMNLNQLSAKAKDPEINTPVTLKPQSSGFGSPPLSPRSNQSSKKRKTVSSNGQVLSMIKKQISQDLKLLQSNLGLLIQYFGEQNDRGIEPDQDEIMRVFGVSRMIKERMLAGNDQIVKIMKSSQSSLPTHQHSI